MRWFANIFDRAFRDLLTSGFPEDTDFEIKRKVLIVNVVVTIGIVVLTVFAIVALLGGYRLVAALDMSAVLLLFGTACYLRVTGNHVAAGYACTWYMLALLYYLAATGGVNGTGPLWSFTVPLFVLFLSGVGMGSVFALGFIALVGVTFALDLPFLRATYSTDYHVRIISSYLTVYALTFVFEHTRALTQRRMQDRQALLEQTLEEHQAALRALEESEHKYRTFVQGFHGIAYRATLEGEPVFYHGAVEEITGYSEHELLHGSPRWEQLLHDEDAARILLSIRKAHTTPGYCAEQDYRVVHRNGEERWIREHVQNVTDTDGRPLFVQGTIYDITEQVALSEALRQKQKMESIGKLAGGVAHDFNNQLSAIMGYADLLKESLPQGSREQDRARRIGVAARRSADLTHQLLAFARKGKYRIEQIDMHAMVDEVVQLLKHSIDKRITVVRELGAERCTIDGDPSLIQNALLNVAINARDAMPDGGTLTFRTRNVVLDQESVNARPHAVDPGDYCRLDIIDTGCGMTDEVARMAFEPFFTTKGTGKGTGMGLAAAYGTIKGHAGTIDLQSAPGHGTTVIIHLPLSRQKTPGSPTDKRAHASSSRLNILVVDDEPLVREMAVDMLSAMGHHAMLARGSKEAIELYHDPRNPFDVVLLDIEMPDEDGMQVLARLRRIDPEVKVIVASGHGPEGRAGDMIAQGAFAYLQKPFTKNELMDVVERAAAA
ncbi:MAG: response regulator [Chitinivibrionales bacterium]|nr:response regulator [Chitinivibrionales bacterium]